MDYIASTDLGPRRVQARGIVALAITATNAVASCLAHVESGPELTPADRQDMLEHLDEQHALIELLFNRLL